MPSGNRVRRIRLWEQGHRACFWCGGELHLEKSERLPNRLLLTVDHLLPRSYGGPNERANLVAACLSCNTTRSSRINLRAWKALPPHLRQRFRSSVPELSVRLDLEAFGREVVWEKPEPAWGDQRRFRVQLSEFWAS